MTPLPSTALDHLVIGCADLARGAAWLERFLGVTLGPVGEHALMGTQNRLLSLGPECYLELIAINPAASRPSSPRWFGLDTADVRERIAHRPRLIGWVARTSDIVALSEKTGGALGHVLGTCRFTRASGCQIMASDSLGWRPPTRTPPRWSTCSASSVLQKKWS